MIYYCDSSAIAKIYLEEAGTPYMRNLRQSADIGDVVINAISGPEVFSALHRRYRTGDITSKTFTDARQDFDKDFEHFFTRFPVSNPIIRLAMHLIDKYPLRGYDSVQLATALQLQSSLRASNGRNVTFLGSDKVLNNAATNEGLAVINPDEQE